MIEVARRRGYVPADTEQHLADNVVIYPGHFVTPCKRRSAASPHAFAQHRIYGSWRKRKFGRKVELFLKHILTVVRYALFRR